MQQPPSSDDLVYAAAVLRAFKAPENPALEQSCARVADAIEILAPIALEMEKSPGDLAPLLQLLMQANPTEGKA